MLHDVLVSAVMTKLASQRRRVHLEVVAARVEVASLLALDKGPEWGRASRIRARMSHKPSLRTVQRHILACREFMREGISPAH